MGIDLEETLSRELHEVADALTVPPLPALPSQASSDARRPAAARGWQPLLAAAATIVVLGVVALLAGRGGGHDTQPAPAPSPTISRSAPTIGYILDRRLFVQGTEMPGRWASVESRGGVWLAQQVDGSWWWGGPGVDPGRIDAQLEQPPVLSPDGGYVAFIDVSDGSARLTGFDTQPAGEGLGQAPVDLPRAEDGVPIRVRAVTDDGDVIVQGTRTSLMWRAQYQDQRTVVDLSTSAPDQVFLADSAAGLVVVEGSDGAVDGTSTQPYLADISPDGHLTERAALPTYDSLDVGPDGAWLVRAPAGTLGGEVVAVPTLDAQRVGASEQTSLAAPDGWGFANGTWAWEDDRSLISVVLPDGADSGARLARCDVPLGACRLLPSRSADPARSWTADKALAEVVHAAAADDRGALADPAVIADGEWDQLRGWAAGRDGSVASCRDNGGGTRDCEIDLAADRATTYYAIVEPAKNTYGWRVTYVGIGGA